MRTIFVMFLTLIFGGLVAMGIAKLVSFAFPSLEIPVFLILSGWWLWIGWKYANAMDGRQL